jgi:hypothetical protein
VYRQAIGTNKAESKKRACKQLVENLFLSGVAKQEIAEDLKRQVSLLCASTQPRCTGLG